MSRPSEVPSPPPGGEVLREDPRPPQAFVTLSRFTIANGMQREVVQAFQGRPHQVEDAPGFIQLQVLTPQDNPDEIWLLTFWEDEGSFECWHRSHHYKDAHHGIPKGLKLVPGKTSLTFFQQVSS